MSIQSDYNKYQQLGFPGQIAHAYEAYGFDQAQANEEIKPGQGVYLSAGKWVLPTSLATSLLVTHIVGFNQPMVAVTSHADSIAKGGAYGSFVVLAGEDVNIGDVLYFDHTDLEWKIYAPVDPTAADMPKATFVALSSGGDGEPIKVRHYGITNPIAVTTAIV